MRRIIANLLVLGLTMEISLGLTIARANSGVCTFDEDDWCGYSNDQQASTVWIQTPKDGLPANKRFPNDHTTNSRNGRYLYVNTSYTGGYTAALLSAWYPKTSNSCIKFWHYMRSADRLAVQINDDWQSSFTFENDIFSPMWNGIMVPVTCATDWQFMIIGGSEEPDEFVMAIDDIEVTLDEPCEPRGYCDFETDTCMWQNDLQNSYDWTRISVVDGKFEGPPVDHTTSHPSGHFMLLEKGTTGYGSAMISRILETKDALCISFWYYTNSAAFNIEVDVVERYFEEGRPLGIIPSNVTNKWTRVSFDNTAEDDYVQFRIWAKDGSNVDYLAVDDVTFHKVKCDEID